MPSVTSTCSYFALQQTNRIRTFRQPGYGGALHGAFYIHMMHAVISVPVGALEVPQQARSPRKDLHVHMRDEMSRVADMREARRSAGATCSDAVSRRLQHVLGPDA